MVLKLYCRGENLQTKRGEKNARTLYITNDLANNDSGNDDDNDGDVGNDADILQMIFSWVWKFTQDCYKSQTIIFY